MTSVTVLVDNTAPDGLASEHGLALYIEHGQHKMLFDTGQSVAKNVEKGASGSAEMGATQAKNNVTVRARPPCGFLTRGTWGEVIC